MRAYAMTTKQSSGRSNQAIAMPRMQFQVGAAPFMRWRWSGLTVASGPESDRGELVQL
jgi:hypothetical protein